LRGPETQPVYNPLSQLVYVCNGSQVSHSWIAGELVMANRELTRIDLADLATRVVSWEQRISATAGSTQ
jgi:5-methylthioadenosine/S-adenosylhomocysteine deaminase